MVASDDAYWRDLPTGSRTIKVGSALRLLEEYRRAAKRWSNER